MNWLRWFKRKCKHRRVYEILHYQVEGFRVQMGCCNCDWKSPIFADLSDAISYSARMAAHGLGSL